MGLYKRSGSEFWWIRFQANGQEVRRSSGCVSRAAAERAERTLRAQYAATEKDGSRRRTYEDAVIEFGQDHMPSLKLGSRRRYMSSLKALHPFFRAAYLDDITVPRLREFVAARRVQGVTSATIRRDLACLSSILRREVSSGHVDRNVVQVMDKRSIREAPPRTRYLTHDEEAALLRHADPQLAGMIAFAIDTGLRLEEQLSLEWSQVNLARGEVTILRTKTDAPRTVPILPRAAQHLAQLPRHIMSPFVYWHGAGQRFGKRTRGLAGAARRAGIKDLKWHDLRRTCGCRLLQDHGFDIYRVKTWLGHKTVAVTERSYAFLNTSDLHCAVSRSAQTRG